MSLALIMEHAMRMRRITRLLSFVGYLDVPYLCTLSHKRNDFLKNLRLPNIKLRLLYFSTILSAKFLILGGTERDMITYVDCV